MVRRRLGSDLDINRLSQAIRTDRDVLEFYRTERVNAVKSYVGRHWSEEADGPAQPVNFLALYVSVVGRNLVPKSPRCDLSTWSRADGPTVDKMQAWANPEIERINLAGSLRRAVLDALFCIGIMKIGISDPADAGLTGWSRKAGNVGAWRVDLDDWVYDTHARDFTEAGYMGHRRRAHYDIVQQSKLYTAKGRAALKPSQDWRYNTEGDERIGALTRGSVGSDYEEFEDYVDLWEIYHPRKKLIYTLRADEGGGPVDEEPIRVQEWIGPDSGPYHFLRFGDVPDSAMPLAPIMNLRDLADLGNSLFRKLDRQARRQKKVLPVQGASDKDIMELNKTPDGMAFRCDGAPPAEVSYGGPSPENIAFFQMVQSLFDFFGGNLALLGGRAPQSKTAAQDKMLNENASAGIGDLQDTTTVFTSQVLGALNWFWWHDPFLEMRSQLMIDPSLAPMNRTLRPRERQRSKWSDLNVKVDPYSMRFQTPEGRLAAIMGLMQTIVIPLMPMLQQQGVTVDLHEFLKMWSEMSDQPDVDRFISMQEPPPTEDGPAGPSHEAKPGGGAPTERRYIRENIPARTDRGDAQHRMNSLLGVKTGGAPEQNGSAMPSY